MMILAGDSAGLGAWLDLVAVVLFILAYLMAQKVTVALPVSPPPMTPPPTTG